MYKCSDWLLRNFFKMKRMPIFLIYLVSLYWTKKKGFNLNLIFFLSLNSETLNFSFVRKKFWFSLFRWVFAVRWIHSVLANFCFWLIFYFLFLQFCACLNCLVIDVYFDWLLRKYWKWKGRQSFKMVIFTLMSFW